MMKPRGYSLLLYSLLSYHSLFDFIAPPFVPIIGPSTLQSDIISLIPIPLFLFLYPAPSFVLLSLCDPYSCRISLFVLDSLYEGAPIHGECDCDALVRNGGNSQIYKDELIGKRRTKEHWTKIKGKLTMFILTLLQ